MLSQSWLRGGRQQAIPKPGFSGWRSKSPGTLLAGLAIDPGLVPCKKTQPVVFLLATVAWLLCISSAAEEHLEMFLLGRSGLPYLISVFVLTSWGRGVVSAWLFLPCFVTDACVFHARGEPAGAPWGHPPGEVL